MEATTTSNEVLHSIHVVPNLLQAPPGGVRQRPTDPPLDAKFIRGYRLTRVDIRISGGIHTDPEELQARRRR